MDFSTIFHILIAFGALQALFLSAILISQGKKPEYRLFASFLLIEGVTLVERLLAETNLMTDFPHVLGISYPLSFLKPPLLFILATKLTRPDFSFQKRHLLHGIPFLGMLLLNIPFYLLPAEEKVLYVSRFINYIPAYNSFNFWFFLSFFLYIGGYLFFSMQVLLRYQEHIKNHRLINGFAHVLYLYAGLLLMMLVHFLLRPTGLVEFPYVNEVSMLLMTFLIQSIAYQFLSASRFMTDQTSPKIDSDLKVWSAQVQRIKEKLEVEKAYLDDTLSLEGFSESLEIPKKQVSEIINQSLGTTFKSLLNRHRVEEAILLMKTSPEDQVKLVENGLRSGFNNKVSFYRAFKKETGQSPSDFFQTIQKK